MDDIKVKKIPQFVLIFFLYELKIRSDRVLPQAGSDIRFSSSTSQTEPQICSLTAEHFWFIEAYVN